MPQPLHEAVITGALRTPIGKYGGVLWDIRPDDLSTGILKALMECTGVDPKAIQDVMWGCANQAGEDDI
jgi:acetyl-CoA acetyltransferase